MLFGSFHFFFFIPIHVQILFYFFWSWSAEIEFFWRGLHVDLVLWSQTSYQVPCLYSTLIFFLFPLHFLKAFQYLILCLKNLHETLRYFHENDLFIIKCLLLMEKKFFWNIFFLIPPFGEGGLFHLRIQFLSTSWNFHIISDLQGLNFFNLN